LPGGLGQREKAWVPGSVTCVTRAVNIDGNAGSDA
jgi:hypothetical protein